MEFVRLTRGDGAYPAALARYLKDDAPLTVAACGNLAALGHNTLAMFCSAQCSDTVNLQIHDLLHELMETGTSVIGGFHSPVEKEWLSILLTGAQPVAICPARSLKKMRMRQEWRKPFEQGRLLFLSPFADHRHRADVQMALRRNRFAAAIADKILIPHAAPGGKTEQLCKEIVSWGKSLFTLAIPANDNLVALGATSIAPREISQLR